MSVRCIFEDREVNLWIGSSVGLIRFRDDVFTVYGKPEGLPSDEPDTVYQDRHGKIWVGFQDGGMMLFSGAVPQAFATNPGMPKGRVYSIRETRSGELLHCCSIPRRTHPAWGEIGLACDLLFRRIRWPLGRKTVFDALETSDGMQYLARIDDRVGRAPRLDFPYDDPRRRRA